MEIGTEHGQFDEEQWSGYLEGDGKQLGKAPV